MSSYSLSVQMNSFAKSREKMNCRRGLPVPETTNGVPFSDRQLPVGSNRTFCEVALVYQSWNDMRLI